MALKKLLPLLIMLPLFWPAVLYAGLNQTLYLEMGSVRHIYFYPMMNLGYTVENPFGVNGLSAGGSVRSYGTFFLLNFYSYDFQAFAGYSGQAAGGAGWALTLGAGAGAELRLRMVRDVRSEEKTTCEPMVTAHAGLRFYGLDCRVPVTALFYTDGLALRGGLQAVYWFGSLGIRLYSEPELLWRYQNGQTALAWNNFLGVAWKFEESDNKE